MGQRRRPVAVKRVTRTIQYIGSSEWIEQTALHSAVPFDGLKHMGTHGTIVSTTSALSRVRLAWWFRRMYRLMK